MPRQQPPDQQQYQKSLNPDNLVADDEDTEDDTDTDTDTDLDRTEVAPTEGDQRLAQDEGQQHPEDNIDQVEDEEAEDDEDESDQISQRP